LCQDESLGLELKFLSSLPTHHLYAQTYQHIPPDGNVGLSAIACNRLPTGHCTAMPERQRLPAPGWRFSDAAMR